MAIVTPVFLLLVFSLVEFSRMAMINQALTDAARAGCRKAALATTRSGEEVNQAIHEHMDAFLADTDLCRINLSAMDLGSMQPGTPITASVEVDCSKVSLIAPKFLSNHVLRGEATMNRE